MKKLFSTLSLLIVFAGFSQNNLPGMTFLTSNVYKGTAATFTASATVTVPQILGGVLTVSSGTCTLTLPTATQIANQIGASAGTVIEFSLVNIANGGTVTIAVGSGITASGFPGTNTLTLAKSTTIGVAGFRIHFLSSSAATLTRIN